VKVFTFTGLPLGVTIALPGGVVTTDARNCAPSGTVSDVVDSGSDNALSPGDTWTTTYTNCANSSGSVISGSFARTYTAYTSSSNYTYTLKASSVTGQVAGTAFGPYAFDATNTVTANVGDVRYLVDGHWVVGQPEGDRTGNTVTLRRATVRAAQGAGYVEMVYSNWAWDAASGRPVGTAGSVVLTGAGGNTATVKAGANGYDVSIVVGGAAAQTFTVPYPG
jgi:hypothetical protein